LIPIKDDNPSRSFPFITILLIAANAALFVYQFSLGPVGQTFVLRFGAIPWEITHLKELPGLPARSVAGIPTVLTLFTSMFLHGGILHLLGNMLYLWIFGDNIESLIGHFRFLTFYLLCGLTAALTYVVFDPNSHIPMIGASGAISGVLGAYMINFPSARVNVLVFLFFFIRIIKIPALIVLGFWFLIQVLNGFGSLGVRNAGGVAWFAHIGGFVAGILFILLYPKKKYRTSMRVL
jgi:membrane associated rhomboid family serine protease